MKLSQEFISSLAPNNDAIKNGLDLVKKGNFIKLQISQDETLLYGECQGSGKNPYIVSVDFINEDHPISRCNCPSRQFPCKHAVGLMFAYLQNKPFNTVEIPEDILNKRQKMEKKEQKLKENIEPKPKNINKSALIKKIDIQIKGLDYLEGIIDKIVTSGLATLNKKTIDIYYEELKQLGDFYLSSLQTLFIEFLENFNSSIEEKNKNTSYYESINYLIKLSALCKKGKEYLSKKLQDEDITRDVNNNIEELLGHAWQLSELSELNLIQNDVDVIQLSFNVMDNEAKKELAEIGIWYNTNDYRLYETRNYRSYKALKYIKEEDSIFQVLNVKQLYIYPGELNRRIRFEDYTIKELNNNDIQNIYNNANSSYSNLIKIIKNQIKNPLSDKYPTSLIRFKKIGIVNNKLVCENEFMERIILTDNSDVMEPKTCDNLKLLGSKIKNGGVLLVRFITDLMLKELHAKPLTIILENEIIRLGY